MIFLFFISSSLLLSFLRFSSLLSSFFLSSLFSLSSFSVFFLCLCLRVLVVCVSSCVFVWCCVVLCGVCRVVWHAENPVLDSKRFPCVDSKRSPCMPHTLGRFESTHGKRFESTHGGHRLFCLPRTAHVGLSLGPTGSPKVTTGCCPCSSLRTGREQHVPDSSNHSLCLINLLSNSYCGERWREPPVRWFGLSFAPKKQI